VIVFQYPKSPGEVIMKDKSGAPWNFFILTFLITWICWLPGVLDTIGWIPIPLPWGVFYLLGILGPLISALILTYRSGGKPAIKKIFSSAINFHFAWYWYLLIFILPLMVPASALMIYQQSVGLFPDLVIMKQPVFLLTTFLFMFLIGGGPGEFGWRGFALDRMQARWGALMASIILGLIWSVWHLPLFLNQYTRQYFMNFWVFVLIGVSISILTTWVYNRTGKSLLAAWLFHGVINTGMELFSSIQRIKGAGQPAFLFTAIIYLLIAAVVVLAGGLQGVQRPLQKSR
jgi:membrane protease YdiL (CAAX protease family)